MFFFWQQSAAITACFSFGFSSLLLKADWFYYGPRRIEMCSNLPDREHDWALARLILSPANSATHLHVRTGRNHPESALTPFTCNHNFMSWVQNRHQRFSPTRRLPGWVVLSPACLMTGSAVADTAMAGVLVLAASTPEGLGRFWNSVRQLTAVRLVSRSAEASRMDATW